MAHFLTSFTAYNAALMIGTGREDIGDQLAYAMKLIIIPLLTRSFELGQHEIVGDDSVDIMVKHMFEPAEEVQGESHKVKHGRAACRQTAMCATLLQPPETALQGHKLRIDPGLVRHLETVV